MQSWSAKSTEVAILESNVEEGLRERFFLNKFLFVYYIYKILQIIFKGLDWKK